jgi:hypothetical protein
MLIYQKIILVSINKISKGRPQLRNPSMQQPRTFTCLSKSIYKTREHNVNNW